MTWLYRFRDFRFFRDIRENLCPPSRLLRVHKNFDFFNRIFWYNKIFKSGSRYEPVQLVFIITRSPIK